MGGTGPPIEDSGDDAGRFKGEGEEHGWAPDIGTEGNSEGHEASKKAFESSSEEPAPSS